MVVHGEKQNAYTGSRSCSNAGALRGGTVTASGRGISAPASGATPARTSWTTILRGGLAGREKRE